MISAKVVADSLSPQGHRLTTLEVVMPRYILAEFNTHRVLSKNSASSRAIPFSKMVKEVQKNPFIPYAWQKDHKGMQGNEYITDSIIKQECEDIWLQARDNAVVAAMLLNDDNKQDLAVTKQLCNRLLEPFMWHKVLVSATEWENFFNLRCPQYTLYSANKEVQTIDFKSWKELCKNYSVEEDVSHLHKLQHNKGQADIHMMFLAEAIYDAINESTPRVLTEGEWHIPYGEYMDKKELRLLNFKVNGSSHNPDNPEPVENLHKNLDELMCKIAIARCARLSYQTLGDNPVIDYEKDLELYEALSKSGHWSPFEHVARVMTYDEYTTYVRGKLEMAYGDIENGTEVNGWCRNFRGFIQQRALID
jgi:thymidylate synthase ThyX